jgi:hypothetical protein
VGKIKINGSKVKQTKNRKTQDSYSHSILVLLHPFNFQIKNAVPLLLILLFLCLNKSTFHLSVETNLCRHRKILHLSCVVSPTCRRRSLFSVWNWKILDWNWRLIMTNFKVEKLHFSNKKLKSFGTRKRRWNSTLCCLIKK